MGDNKVDVKKENKNQKKNKKQRKGILKTLKEIRYELKQVTWTSKKETLKNTVTVLTVVAISSLIVYGMDSLLSIGLKALVK